MRAQLEERLGHTEAAKAAYQMGLRRCIHSTPLWTSLARLEERSGNLARARAFLEQVAPHSCSFLVLCFCERSLEDSLLASALPLDHSFRPWTAMWDAAHTPRH